MKGHMETVLSYIYLKAFYCSHVIPSQNHISYPHNQCMLSDRLQVLTLMVQRNG